jgi:hypothetical protein
VPDQDELPLGDDAIELVREHELTVPEPEPPAEDAAEEPAAQEPAVQEPAAQEPVAEEPVAEEPEPVADEAATPEEPVAEEPSGRPSRRKGRASVPSWDEIMFGGGKGE